MPNTDDEDHARYSERRSNANMERHVQTIGIALIVGALTWAAQYFYNDNREKGEDRAQLGILTTQVIELRADFKAAQLSFARREDMDKLERRILDMETRLRVLERAR